MTEVVRGTIIGPITWPYEFWTKPDKDGYQMLVAKRGFENDDEAIAWVRERYPAHFAAGLEMRVYGQG